MTHDQDVQALLNFLAAQAQTRGSIVITEDIAAALDTAAWKLDQQHTPAACRAYHCNHTPA